MFVYMCTRVRVCKCVRARTCMCVCACMCKSWCQKLDEIDLSNIDLEEKKCILVCILNNVWIMYISLHSNIYTNRYRYLPHLQRLCKETNRRFYDSSINLQTDRICKTFSSDYTARAALRWSTFKMPFGSLKECNVPNNTFCNYYQIHLPDISKQKITQIRAYLIL